MEQKVSITVAMAAWRHGGARARKQIDLFDRFWCFAKNSKFTRSGNFTRKNVSFTVFRYYAGVGLLKIEREKLCKLTLAIFSDETPAPSTNFPDRSTATPQQHQGLL
jgi:hypothetical protein